MFDIGSVSSSYFKPTYLSNLLLWLDGSDPDANGVTPSNGSVVTTWKDKSPNGYDFSQSTTLQKPINSNSFQNGRNAIQFGSVVFSQMDSAATIDLTASFSLLVAFYPTSTLQGYIFNLATANTPELWVIAENNNLRNGIGTTGSHGEVTGSAAINNFYIATYVYDSTGNAQMWINGSSQGTTSTDSTSAAGAIARRIGDSQGNPALYYRGYVGDYIMAMGAWSTSTRRQMEVWAGNKWGVSV